MYRLMFGCLLMLALVLFVGFAQHRDSSHEPSSHQYGAPAAAGQWDGSPEGVAYSEFNHHLAGVFVLLVGLELLVYTE